MFFKPVFFKYQCGFSFRHVDDFWYRTGSVLPSVIGDITKTQFSNETDLSVPNTVSDLLSLGPRFRISPKLDQKFLDRLDRNLDNLTYRLRWCNFVFSKKPRTILMSLFIAILLLYHLKWIQKKKTTFLRWSLRLRMLGKKEIEKLKKNENYQET